MNGITRKTFEDMTIDSKLNVLFDCSCQLNDKLEKHKVRIFMFASGGGIIGGMATVIAKWAFWGG